MPANSAGTFGETVDRQGDVCAPNCIGKEFGIVSDLFETLHPRSCWEATATNPLLGCPDLAGCQPTVCDAGDATFYELVMEENSFINSHPPCTAVPLELLCRMKSRKLGMDWPAQVESEIAEASAAAGGFLENQVAALRCLAYLEPNDKFEILSESVTSGVPTLVELALRVDVGSPGEGVLEQVVSTYGSLSAPLPQGASTRNGDNVMYGVGRR